MKDLMMDKRQGFIYPFNKVVQRWLPICFLLFAFVAESIALNSIKKPGLQIGKEKAKTDFFGFGTSPPSAESSTWVILASQAGMAVGFPTIIIDSGMGPFEAAVGQEHKQYYFVDGEGFADGASVLLEINDPSGSFTISTSKDSGFGSTIGLVAGSDGRFSAMVWVKYAPTEAGGHTATIDHSGGGAETKTLTADGNGGALPVEWLSFKARADKGAIVLDWVTASEKNNSHFEIELSKNPLVGFEKIGRVESKVGNSQSATHYRFAYNIEAAMGTYYFRLKQVDTDHAFDYSKVVATETVGLSGADVKVAPNPVTPASQISIAIAEAGELRVLILAMNGATVYSKNFALEAGQNKIQLQLNDRIAAGLYMLSTEFNGRFSRLKLVKE